MNKRITIPSFIVLILIVIALGYDKCNRGVSADIAQLTNENKNYKKRIAELTTEKKEFVFAAESWHDKYLKAADSIELIRKQRSAMSAKIAQVQSQINALQPKVDASTDSITAEFAQRTEDLCHEDSIGECLNDSAVISVGRLIDANAQLEVSEYYVEQLSYFRQKDALNDRGQQACETAINSLSNEANNYRFALLSSDSASSLKDSTIVNLHLIADNKRKQSNRKIIGWTLGGFSVGVGVTALAILLKK